jgi:hypothetical protein
LTCHLSGGSDVAIGDVLNLSIPANCSHLFDAKGVAMRRHYLVPQRRAA